MQYTDISLSTKDLQIKRLTNWQQTTEINIAFLQYIHHKGKEHTLHCRISAVKICSHSSYTMQRLGKLNRFTPCTGQHKKHPKMFPTLHVNSIHHYHEVNLRLWHSLIQLGIQESLEAYTVHVRAVKDLRQSRAVVNSDAGRNYHETSHTSSTSNLWCRLLLPAERFQHEPHRSSTDSNVLDLASDLVLHITQTQWCMQYNDCNTDTSDFACSWKLVFLQNLHSIWMPCWQYQLRSHQVFHCKADNNTLCRSRQVY